MQVMEEGVGRPRWRQVKGYMNGSSCHSIDHIRQFHYLQWEKIITFRSNNQKMKSQIKEWTYYQQDYWYSETQICAYLRSKSSSRLSVHLKHYIYLAKQTVLLSFNNKLIEASLWDNLGKVSLYIYIRLEVY